MVHGRIVDLNLLKSLHCHIKSLFDFQGQANILSNTPKLAYEPFIRLFYANLISMSVGEFETLVMGKCNFTNCVMFDALFDINYSDFSTFSKNLWPF